MKSVRQRGSGRSSSFRCADPPLPRRGTGFIALGEKIQLVLNNMKAEISGRIRRQRSLSPWPPPESEGEQNNRKIQSAVFLHSPYCPIGGSLTVAG